MPGYLFVNGEPQIVDWSMPDDALHWTDKEISEMLAMPRRPLVLNRITPSIPDPASAAGPDPLQDLCDAQAAQILALRQSLDIALARIHELTAPPPAPVDPLYRALAVGTVAR
jgi:hypothetical protein